MNASFRKPVSFAQYYFILIKDHSLWCFDSGSWDYQEMRQAEHDAKQEYGKDNVKLCTSPSDNDIVVSRIVRAYNHKK